MDYSCLDGDHFPHSFLWWCVTVVCVAGWIINKHCDTFAPRIKVYPEVVQILFFWIMQLHWYMCACMRLHTCVCVTLVYSMNAK